MKIVHVINSMSQTYGGPAYSTLLTVRGLNRQNLEALVLTKDLLPGEKAVSDDSFIRYLPLSRFYYDRWGYVASYSKALLTIPSVDVYHIQGLWQYYGYITAQCAQKRKCPYVVSLRGAMHPEAMKYSSWVKKIALFLFERKLLQEAACIHVTCLQEMEAYRSLGFTNPVAVVPNPMEIYEVETPVWADGKRRIGFLGRLCEYKHPERLLDVWKRLDEPGELLIMGDGTPEFVSGLQREVKRLQLSHVRLMGWVSGREKRALLASLACLVVPSDFENFGMIVPEALLQEVPVIASTGSPWQELETERCGWWVKNDVDSLTAAVREALSLDKEELQAMGERGRKLILDKYSIDVVSHQMERLYAWIVGRGDKPEFIYD